MASIPPRHGRRRFLTPISWLLAPRVFLHHRLELEPREMTSEKRGTRRRGPHTRPAGYTSRSNCCVEPNQQPTSRCRTHSLISIRLFPIQLLSNGSVVRFSIRSRSRSLPSAVRREEDVEFPFSFPIPRRRAAATLTTERRQ